MRRYGSNSSRKQIEVEVELEIEVIDSCRIANMYFTGNVNAKDRIRSLHEFYKMNLNEMRAKKECAK